MQPSLFDPQATNRARDDALKRITQHANDAVPGFVEQAQRVVLNLLRLDGPQSGEVLTAKVKIAGIRPHDDRAFGPVYQGLVRAGKIRRVGTCRRERGHGTSGGTVWGLV